MKNLEKLNSVQGVYRLFGDDILMIERAEKLIEQKMHLEMPDLNKSVFTDENFDIEKLLLSCEQMPFLSEKRLVVLKNIEKLKADDLKKLDAYCRSPADTSVLVLQENVSGTVFSKLPAEKVHCKKLESKDLEAIIITAFTENNQTVTSEAVNLIIDFCGKDLLCIQNSLSKLLYCGKQQITPEIVKKLVKKSDEFSVFEISTALTYGQGNKAIILIKKMLETMEFPVILGLISSHFRRMLYGVISDLPPAQIAENLGVKEFAITKARSLAKNISAPKLLKIYNLILEVDYSIKSGKLSAENAMYYLVCEIVDAIKG